MIILKAGEEIRNAKGELLLTVVNNVFSGTIPNAEDFRLPNGDHPPLGSIVPAEVMRLVEERLNDRT